MVSFNCCPVRALSLWYVVTAVDVLPTAAAVVARDNLPALSYTVAMMLYVPGFVYV